MTRTSAPQPVEVSPPRPYADPLGKGDKLRRLTWEVARTLLFRPTPRGLMHGWRRGLLRCFGATVGRGCRIDPSCKIWAPWNLQLGDYVAIAGQVDCYCVDKISLGDKVAVSQRSFLCTASHAIDTLEKPLVHSPIVIHDHAWICAEAFVGPGVTVGQGAVVAARAAVTRDVPPWHVVAGVPARTLKTREIARADQS